MSAKASFHREFTRRQVLAASGAGALALSKPAWGQTIIDLSLPGGGGGREITTSFPQKGPMILQRTRPPLLETPLEVFDKGVFTPNDQFCFYQSARIKGSRCRSGDPRRRQAARLLSYRRGRSISQRAEPALAVEPLRGGLTVLMGSGGNITVLSGNSPTRCSGIRRQVCSVTRNSPAGYPGGQAEYLRVPFAEPLRKGIDGDDLVGAEFGRDDAWGGPT